MFMEGCLLYSLLIVTPPSNIMNATNKTWWQQLAKIHNERDEGGTKINEINDDFLLINVEVLGKTMKIGQRSKP